MMVLPIWQLRSRSLETRARKSASGYLMGQSDDAHKGNHQSAPFDGSRRVWMHRTEILVRAGCREVERKFVSRIERLLEELRPRGHRVWDASRCCPRLKVTSVNAEKGAQLVVGDFHRSRRRCRTRRWLRERGRQGGVKGDVDLNLLHDLVDVAVEHRHRTEALEMVERARRVFGAPAPGWIDAPQRNVREDDDRGRGRAAFESDTLLQDSRRQSSGRDSIRAGCHRIRNLKCSRFGSARRS
jgi:hypothetical protein